MAMEMSRHHSKQLYKHAVPVVVLGLLLLAVSAATFGRYSNLGSNEKIELGRTMVTPALRIKPASNGLAQVTLDSGSSGQSLEGRIGTSEFSQAGRVAGLSLTILTTSAP